MSLFEDITEQVTGIARTEALPIVRVVEGATAMPFDLEMNGESLRLSQRQMHALVEQCAIALETFAQIEDDTKLRIMRGWS
jgi:hypothetical protein